MNQVAAIDFPPVTALSTLTDVDLADAKSFAALEKSEATRRAYRSDFSLFSTWCAARGVSSLPAAPSTAAAFLASEATRGCKASTIGRRAAAIGYAHRLAGHEPPTSAETVRAVVRGIRRSIGTASVRKAPATADVVMSMLALCSETLSGKRDRALLALGFAGAFRRSELVALTIADLTDVSDGYRVMVRRSKTDQEGAGAELAIPHGYRIRPVEALKAWLDASGITEGPVFRPVLKGARVQAEALSAHSVGEIVKRYAKRVGLDPTAFAGHSLRSGYVTSAAETGADLMKICDQTRHRSLEMLRIYIRAADLFKAHSGAAFL